MQTTSKSAAPVNPTFLGQMFALALPVMAQQFMMYALQAVDVLMVGQLNDTAVAAVGIADHMAFLLTLFLFGVSSGAAIFAAQAWGKGDLVQVQRSLGLSLVIALFGAGILSSIALFIPEQTMRLFTADPAVVAVGADYLRLVAAGYPPMAATFAFAAVLRSTGEVRLPMMVSVFALSLNSLGNYGLIFGNFGLPQLGTSGAALSTAVARCIECGLLLSIIYARRLPAAAGPAIMLALPAAFVWRYLTVTAPVVFTEVVWALGMISYRGIYARIDTAAIAAVNIVSTIERLGIAIAISFSTAAAIMIGQRIGAGAIDAAVDYARRFVLVQLGAGMLIGLLLFLGAPYVSAFYNISPAAAEATRLSMQVTGLVFWLKGLNAMVFIGVMRAGGDTRFGMIAEVGSIWLIGVPLALAGAFLLHWPVHLVLLLTAGDTIFKLAIGWPRFRSRRWIHRLTE
jgi:putative MATE family efflux protein